MAPGAPEPRPSKAAALPVIPAGASTTLSSDWSTWTADLNLDPTVSSGNTTYDLSNSGELTVTTVHLDGSSTTTGYMPDDPNYTEMMGAYTQAIDAMDEGNSFTNQSVLAKYGLHLLSHDITTTTPSTMGAALTATGGSGQRPPSGKPPTSPSSDDGEKRPTLYRMGNKTSPRLTNVRINRPNGLPDDITPDENGNVCPNQGGISFSEIPTGKNLWSLSPETDIGENLQLRNDHGTHWSLEPAKEMPLQAYLDALANLESALKPCF